MLKFDTLIIGSGLAGLTLALKLAEHQKVGLITKKSLLDGASSWAQGGIAAVLSDDAIVSRLNNEGIEIARRTIVKYRDSLGILSSVQRRRESRQGR